MINCPHANHCSGCPWISLPYEEQLQKKKLSFQEEWKKAGLPELDFELSIKSVGEERLRERADLRIQEGRFGLHSLKQNEVIDLTCCPMMTGPLETWFLELRKDLPQIKTGSLRLRIAPDGTRGIWLDFANQDIKRLLEESDWLVKTQALAIVEAGQKRKRVIQKENRLGLGDPVFYPWTETYYKDKTFPLLTTIGSFTQAGRATNRTLVETLLTLLPKDISGQWVELGSGAGTFTLPLWEHGLDLTAIEMDPLALESLNLSAKFSQMSHEEKIQDVNFTKPGEKLKSFLETARGIVADPPRSGLGNNGVLPTLSELSPNARPKHFLYLSCLQESLIKDSLALHTLGYRLQKVIGVDQFAQTPHCEWIAAFQLAE
jgi:23S rRNA (uracil1939-C5)-methyltransferase